MLHTAIGISKINTWYLLPSNDTYTEDIPTCQTALVQSTSH